MSSPRRSPLDKEKFLEGNRQRWALVFVLMGLLVMVASSYGWIKDPAPFLTYFTGIGVTFILGASASAVMSSWKVESSSSSDRTENTNTTRKDPKDFDDGSTD